MSDVAMSNETVDLSVLTDSAAMALTPLSDRVRAVTVLRSEGRVQAADALLHADGRS